MLTHICLLSNCTWLHERKKMFDVLTDTIVLKYKKTCERPFRKYTILISQYTNQEFFEEEHKSFLLMN
jgi:hypothetical protein